MKIIFMPISHLSHEIFTLNKAYLILLLSSRRIRIFWEYMQVGYLSIVTVRTYTHNLCNI